MINDNLNPYDKNLSTVFKTLSKTVKGNATAESALQLLKEHVNRKTPKSRVKTAKTYGIEPTDIVSQSADYIGGERTPRSININQVIEGIGSSGRTVAILKKELGICEGDLNYYKRWGYINIASSKGVA
tara:strand:+ start:419 stop:805 length:387 start_codon:yes stop_codon:yes gene_type:complete